ncbi:hypothetical protein CcCBS67573_g09985 [Chytriomyces confervae]|uniref:Retrotransposon gag domain-containing protein n=1 Tax=Chytriomyces confervae TaxID=246404 RepID=A0A507DL63_9FUNG|nr:hypothetical protein CcCBS67573_g09985 [Chytriomyces confervae]
MNQATSPAESQQATSQEQQLQQILQAYNQLLETNQFLFTAAGLTDHARISWRRIPESERASMTWDQYKEWIQKSFGSLLTLPQAIEAMEKLNQSKSATLYTAQFNACTLLNSTNLTMPELFRITDNLDKLQQEAEKLDDLMFRHARRTQNNSSQSFRANQTSFKKPPSTPSFRNAFPSLDDPMDLSNTEQSQGRAC